MAKCVVIGGNGFIGSHLCDELVRRGHSVLSFDRFSSEPRFVEREIEVLEGDFLNRDDLKRALRGADFVFHFLSLTTPASAESDPTLDVRTNVSQSIELLQIAADERAQRVIYASTGGAIYGDGGDPVKDEDSATSPVSPYAIGKLAVEHYLRYFKQTRGLNHTTLRISNPYGPRQPAHRKQGLIPIALRRVRDGLPILLYGDGSMVRDFIFVTDVAYYAARIAENQPMFPVYNVGSGTGYTISQIVAAIEEVVGRSVEVDRRDVPPTYVAKVVLSTGRLRREFADGDHRDTPLMEGIELTWRSILAEGQGES